MTSPPDYLIVPADQPSYVPIGGNEIMLLGEYSRCVPVTCADCGRSVSFKLITDDLLNDYQCDEALNAYLREHGWRVEDDDTCPNCKER